MPSRSMFQRGKDKQPQAASTGALDNFRDAASSERKLGLVPLSGFDEDSVHSQRIEVVAVHGLNGDLCNTWTCKGVIWFRDILPGIVKGSNLRISTYGYNANVAFADSVSTLRDFALGLLNALQLLRERTNTCGVPTYFICHSLGGIVVKKALIIAEERRDLYSDIATSTKVILFLGTPHAGSDIPKWTGIIRRLGNCAGLRMNMVQSLKSRSAELAEISAQFVNITSRVRVISAYETKPWHGLMIVDKDSAVMNVPNERPIPIEANHREICRFSSINDLEYRSILDALASSIEDSQRLLAHELLNSLYFGQFEDRRLAVSATYGNTFQWVWSNPQFRRWLCSGTSTLLWLQGKPGSGKSTMAKYVRASLVSKNLADILGEPPLSLDTRKVVVDFFYSARGGYHQQNHRWMLRSILYQVLSEMKDLAQEYITILSKCRNRIAEYISSHGLDHRDDLAWLSNALDMDDWSYEELLMIFNGLGTTSQIPSDIYIIVDAMDESDNQNRWEILDTLLKVGSHDRRWPVTFHVLVASRPSPLIEHILGAREIVTLQNETLRDIEIFVEGEISRIAEEVLYCATSELEDIAEGLVSKSQGVFLWVKLVIDELKHRAINESCTIDEMERLLESLPVELAGLYDIMAQRLISQSVENVAETREILLWVTHWPGTAKLRLSHIGDILALLACKSKHLSEINLRRCRLVSDKDIRKRIIARSSNLVEVRAEDQLVQYIHQTAREYVLRLPEGHMLSVPFASAPSMMAGTLDSCSEFLLSRLPEEFELSNSTKTIGVVPTPTGLPLFELRKLDLEPWLSLLHALGPSLLELILSFRTGEMVTAVHAKLKGALEGVFTASLLRESADWLMVIDDCRIFDYIWSSSTTASPIFYVEAKSNTNQGIPMTALKVNLKAGHTPTGRSAEAFIKVKETSRIHLRWPIGILVVASLPALAYILNRGSHRLLDGQLLHAAIAHELPNLDGVDCGSEKWKLIHEHFPDILPRSNY